jgi:hypothetical protein
MIEIVSWSVRVYLELFSQLLWFGASIHSVVISDIDDFSSRIGVESESNADHPQGPQM